jgi:RimJ/RimL family protein N-acetyltransferase
MFARTQRLTLRPGWPEDSAIVARAIGHESVATKLSRVPWPYSEADAAQWLTMERARDNVYCLIFAHEEPTPHLIGSIGIHPAEDGHGGHEIGYWLTPDAWGRGYATEAGRAMLGIARYAMGLTRLVSGHFVDNPASGNVLRKLGFRPTGRVEPQFCRARGHEVDCVKLERTFDHDEPIARMPIAA